LILLYFYLSLDFNVNTSSPTAERTLDPARGYQGFEAFVRRVERWVVASAPPVGGYSRQVVGRRLMQQVVDLSVYPFIIAAASDHAAVATLTPQFSGTVRLGGLRFRDDRVTVTLARRAQSFGTFFVQWFRVVANLAGTERNTGPERATLLMGVGTADLVVDGSDTRFVAFCERGPLPPLGNATHLVVESAHLFTSSRPQWVSYSRQPLLALLRTHPPRGRELLRFLGTHLRVAASYVLRSVSQPLVCLLARDMALHATAAYLNRTGVLEAVVITNAHFHVQALWMQSLPGRRFGLHMAWYSQNTRPFLYKTDGAVATLPQYRHMTVDAHWVWTEGYAAHLRTLSTTARVHVVGPILWYLPEAKPPATPSPTVAIFDITPVREAYAQQIGLPRNYYSTSNMIAFLQQATIACERVAARLGRPVLVLLKHKRSHSGVHDPIYLEYVDGLVGAGRIRLLPPQTNLYSLISGSAAIVVVPFSSPAYVASALEVPAIFLDPTDSIEDTHEPAPYVDFAAGDAALAAKLHAALCTHKQETRLA
jgi:hypothetical protein